MSWRNTPPSPKAGEGGFEGAYRLSLGDGDREPRKDDSQDADKF